LTFITHKCYLASTAHFEKKKKLTTVTISKDKLTSCSDKELYHTQSIFQAEEHLRFHKFLHPLNPELGLKKQTKEKLEPATALFRLLHSSI